MCKPKHAWSKSKFQLIMQTKIKYGFAVQIAWIGESILREELKSSRRKHRAWISVHRASSPHSRETLYTHDILHWVGQIFAMHKRVQTIWKQRVCIRKLQQEYICKGIFLFSWKRYVKISNTNAFTHLAFVPLSRALLLQEQQAQPTLPKPQHELLSDRQSQFWK